ncbi:MAG: hypothetical protein M3Z20_19840, partial [Chloroflexota bacterium]|nr:hypothetical protein [Chloroflexota bacterium]
MQHNGSAFSPKLALSRRRVMQAGFATAAITLTPLMAWRVDAAQTEATPIPLPSDALPQEQQ